MHAFGDCVDALAARHPQLRHFYCYGPLSREQLEEWLPAERDLDAYFVGPAPFMAQLKRHLAQLGVPPAQLHWEFFGPAEALAA